jgi:hypothetical protein
MLTFPKDSQPKIGAAMINNGMYIRPVNSSGEVVDITIDTPIIYNIGNFHYEAGRNKITPEMLDLIKKNYQDYTQYTNLAPIKVVKDNPGNYPVINKATYDSFIANKNAKKTQIISCRFKEGDQIMLNGEQYTVLDRRTTGGTVCENYTLINNASKNIVVKTATNVDDENPAPASTTKTTNQILTDFLNGTQYQPNIQNIDNYIINKGGNISAILQVALNNDAGFLTDTKKDIEKNYINQIINGTKVITGGKRQRKSRKNGNKSKKSKKTRRSKKN